MKLNQLEILCKIIELGSFSKAAEALHLSQPTLTEHIKSLERDLGTSLLDRFGREIAPTKAGEILQEYARRIMRLTEEAEQKVRSLQGDLAGNLTVGASTIPGEFILPTLMSGFRQRYPGILVHIAISDSKKIISAVSENKVEAGVVGTKIESPKLTYRTFLSDELVLVSPVDAPWTRKKRISLQELSTVPFLSREEGSATRLTLERALKQANSLGTFNTVAVLGSTTAVIQGIKSGIGCSILSRRAVQEDLAQGTLRETALEGLKLSRDFYLVLRKGKTSSPLCDAFVDFLFKKAPAT